MVAYRVPVVHVVQENEFFASRALSRKRQSTLHSARMFTLHTRRSNTVICCCGPGVGHDSRNVWSTESDNCFCGSGKNSIKILGMMSDGSGGSKLEDNVEAPITDESSRPSRLSARLMHCYKTPGEFWASVGSLAGLRVVSAFGVIQNEKIETINLDSGYLQTEHQLKDYFLEIADELVQGLREIPLAVFEEIAARRRSASGRQTRRNTAVPFFIHSCIHSRSRL